MRRILTSIFVLFQIIAFAQSSCLDNTFGTSGIVTTDFNQNYDDASAIAIQTDGKIVVAGNSGYDYEIARYNSNGSLDNNFGTNGLVKTTVGYTTSLAVNSTNGKIVVAGYAMTGTDNFFALGMFNSDGSFDSGFGTGGQVITDVPNTIADRIHAVALQPNGKIVVAGFSSINTNYNFVVGRYNTDGTLDNSFYGTGGIASTAIGSGDDVANAVAVQTDGRIIAGGYSNNGTNNQFALVRYNSDGSFDNNFGTNGIVTTTIGTSGDIIHSLVLQADGKILVAGETTSGATTKWALVRYNANGTLDNTFGTNGIVTSTIGTNGIAYSIAVQANGKIVVAGSSGFNVVRYNTDGTLDNSFCTNGKATTTFGTYAAYPKAVAIQSDGKILATGTRVIPQQSGFGDFAVVRYNSSGNVGIENLSSDETLVLYPNPATNELFIQTNGIEVEQINIYNTTGSLISQTKQPQSKSVDISQLADGVYIAEIKMKDVAVKKRWVKL